MIEFWFPYPPKELNPNHKIHPAKKSPHVKRYKESCFYLAKQQGAKLEVGKIYLFITFYPPSKQHRDDDNCISSFKAGRDGLAAALKIDDKYFTVFHLLSEKVVKGGSVRVRIAEPPEGLLEMFD